MASSVLSVVFLLVVVVSCAQAIFQSTYECHKYDKGGKNNWHYVTITFNKRSNTYTWSNRAGKSWTMYPRSATELNVGRDCPYYNRGFRVAKFTQDGLYGPWGEFYDRQMDTNFALFRVGMWYLGSYKKLHWGTRGDIPIPAKYFNERQKRLTVFRPRNGGWYFKGKGFRDYRQTLSDNIFLQAGIRRDVPVPGDYDGNQQTQIAVWRPRNGVWYIKGYGEKHWGKTARQNKAIQCGMRGDVPVPADYFSEGKMRIAVWRPSRGMWYIKGPGFRHWAQSRGNKAVQCGQRGDIPVPGDYFGDGVVRLAVWRPSNGMWYIKGKGMKNWSQSGGNIKIQCGMKGDIPTPFDFYGEGKLRIAVYRPSNGYFYVKGPGNNHWHQTKGNLAYRTPLGRCHNCVPTDIRMM